MFAFLRGELVTASREEVVVEVSGIGYLLHISSGTSRRLPSEGSQVRLFTHHHVREDLQQLFGFLDEEELQLFRLLLTISGVGPKLAMAVLSGLSVGEVQEAIVANRPETLYGITGVGKKTAARIILELRDKILKIQPAASGKTAGEPHAIQLNEDALAALMTLGFPRQTAQKAVSGVLESSPALSVEELVRAALTAIHNNS
ncbi:Holliday junction branch migration protein RuvA [Chlorobaculum thiosulfatiphilum]|jgi:Holliday junction DNA helicase RuvA|uniref:Holliday junction branch migration complex subunit RuvA n=1 Tax=Chlorobaculum thiosulfatiphilum TaxID=115852 RepID=A0A5C4S7K3_CHLTI|nr:Holliday junction branch migration protein RuvA [Chlorobaculum thiosulfatiphilum]TNJ39108.1 Holliday junction branch migration protein RuvA [Chlorobaculum thiosulfatiphilum]